jgi:hypothetical protein
MWNATPDGSIIDETGKVLFFSTNRFIDDICLGDCCFICGAKPGQKPFNNEHILPEWLLRRYNLFAGTITLPNGNKVRYDRYTVPCCAECNSLMGTEIETPISNAVNAGSEVFADFIVKNCLLIFTWMGLIFLKTHLKDRKFRVHLDQRMGDMIFSGVFERHPRLTLAIVEFELAWAPNVLSSMDYTYRERHGEAIYRFKNGMLPSDFFRRNIVLSFQEDAIGIRLRDVIGVDNMMWGSDYPHSESTFPQSHKILAEILAGVPDDEQAKIAGGNTARVYSFDTARLTVPA